MIAPDRTALLVMAAIFLATIIRSTFGFGEALVAVPLLALLVPVEIAAPVAVLASITIAFIAVVQDWRHIHLRSATWLVLSTLAGIPLGLWLLKAVPESFVKGGLAIVIVGLSLCARAGFLKEAATQDPRADRAHVGQSAGFLGGLLICLLSGITSPMFNFSVAFGGRIRDEAERQGAYGFAASTAVLALSISAGFLINAGYCTILLLRNRSWRLPAEAPAIRNTVLAILMGLLWSAGMFVYGAGASLLGSYGPVLGWPLFMTLMVLTGNFWGLVTGEWKGAGWRALGLLQLGNLAMMLAFVVISVGAGPSP